MVSGAEPRKPSVEMIELGRQDQVQDEHQPHESPWKFVRTYYKLVLFAIIANIGPLMFGYDLVIIGSISALPKFRLDFGDKAGESLVLPALWLGLWNGFVQLGCAAGSVSAGWFQDRYGRRANFLLGGILSIIGTALSYPSGLLPGVDPRRVLFLFAKIIIGMGCGVLMSACQTWISETAPQNLRGLLLGFYAFNVSFGHLLAMAIVFDQIDNMNPSAYQIPFASQWAFGGVAVIAAFVLPESPVWLLAKERVEKAQQALQRLGTARGNTNVLEGIQITLAHENEESATGQGAPTYLECFQGSNFRRTRIIIWLNILQQFVGISLQANGAYFLIMAGMSTRYSLMVSLISIASNMVINMLSWYTVPKFGRRSMIILSIVLDLLVWASMGIAACFQSPSAKWYVGVALLLFSFFNSFGVASAVPVITSEISCVRLRSKSSGIGLAAQSVSFWAFSFFTPYMYNIDEANWGGKIGFFFAGTSLVALLVTWFEVPETKGRSFAELDYLFDAGVAARNFAKTLIPDSDTSGNPTKASEATAF